MYRELILPPKNTPRNVVCSALESLNSFESFIPMVKLRQYVFFYFQLTKINKYLLIRNLKFVCIKCNYRIVFSKYWIDTKDSLCFPTSASHKTKLFLDLLMGFDIVTLDIQAILTTIDARVLVRLRFYELSRKTNFKYTAYF